MTQEEAGKAIGVSANVISNWERGRTYPDAMQIKKIEKVYGVGYKNIIFLPNQYGLTVFKKQEGGPTMELKDPDQVLQIMNRKLKALHKRCAEADGEEAAKIDGQEVAIISIAGHIRHAIEDHGYFGVEDMACVYEYVDDAKENDHEYRNPRDTWFMKGLADGAAWALQEIEKRMEEEP